jgi:3-phenylpropionate/trans-cinnamate dioxygenase ferredoxin subunit
MSRHVVAKADDLQPGEHKVVEVNGREVGLFNIDGEFFALSNRCPHEAGPLCSGMITGIVLSDGPGKYRLERKGESLRCPWHGWEFDLRTGHSWCDPKSTKVRAFQVKVEPGEELVKGPYVAETFPVSVEENYLIVEM